nr:response regulator transcription factor [Marinobacter sp. ATCH36]
MIVEDQTALAENLFEFLGESRYSLDFAADGLTALHLLSSRSYDVVVLDVMLPGLSGFELCKRMRQDLRCDTPVIFMTAKSAMPDKEEGFELGGDDYLVKPFALRELQLRIDALSRRRAASGNAELTAGNLSFDPDTLQVSYRGLHAVELSGAPCRILEALIRSYPKFVSHEELSNVIWGIDEGDTHTLRTHVYTLRKTLQREFGHSMVRSIHGRGYRLELRESDGREMTK